MLINMKTLADRIKERRARLEREERAGLGWSQEDVAMRCGVKQQTYSAVEKGKTRQPGFIVKLAEVLLTTPDWLLYGTGAEEKPLEASMEARVMQVDKSPGEAARDLESQILALCRSLNVEAQTRVDVDRLAKDMKEIFGQVQHSPKSGLKKTG